MDDGSSPSSRPLVLRALWSYPLDSDSLGFPFSEYPSPSTLPTVDEIEFRRDRWFKFLRRSTEVPRYLDSRHKKIRTLARVGIPNDVRSRVWPFLIDIDDLRQSVLRPYEQLVLDEFIPDEDIQAIRNDVPRTFPFHPMFARSHGDEASREMCTPGERSLYRVLVALQNATGGSYTQDRVDEIWDGSSIMKGLRAEMLVLRDVMEWKLPKSLYAKICDLEIDPAFFGAKWFLSLFVSCLPTDVTLRIWDCLLIEGFKVLHRFALAILITLRSSIESFEHSFEFLGDLHKMVENIHDGNALCELAFSIPRFPRKKLSSFRSVALKRVEEEEKSLIRKREDMQEASSSSFTEN